MDNKMVITISDVDGIRQYNTTKYLKRIVLYFISICILAIVATVYYVKDLNAKVDDLTSNNDILTQRIDKNKSVSKVSMQNEKALEGMKKEKNELQVRHEKEKLILKNTLTEKIQKILAEKNKIEKEKELTLKEKNESDKLLDELTKEIENIEKELKIETQLKEKLQKKLSLKVKIKQEKIKNEKERKIELAQRKLKRENLLRKIAKSKLGKRYVWGAVGPGVFDCSGFTSYVYRKVGVNIPRTSIIQAKYGKYIKRKDLQTGDLVFFDTSTRRKGYVNHVGIYLGNNKFIHASSAQKKVVITNLGKPFYSSRYKWARRIN